MTATPTTRYAPGPRGALAYQVTGTGPVDLLMVPGMHPHLELQRQLPGYRRFVRGLTRRCRLIRYAGLDLAAEQARGAWRALQAAEQRIYPATSLAEQS